MIKIALVGLVAGFFSATAQAQMTQTTGTHIGVQADIGTEGAGLHLSTPMIDDALNARIGLSGANYSYTGSTAEVNYEFKLKLQTVEALVDWYVLSGGFRLTAGVVSNGNKVHALAKASNSGTYTFNGHTYDAMQVGTINGDIAFRPTVPYAGLGWGNASSQTAGWAFQRILVPYSRETQNQI